MNEDKELERREPCHGCGLHHGSMGAEIHCMRRKLFELRHDLSEARIDLSATRRK